MHSIKDTVKQLIGKSLDAYNKKYTSPINNRIDNIVAQAGTDNTEIVDARIDSAGVSHTTLNNRILAETKMTDEKLIEYTGSSLSVDDTMPGYLQNIEIKGNTIQNEDNLEDIRSVGDKVEGQELYEIPVLSCGKNLFDGELEKGAIINGSPTITGYDTYFRSKNFIQVESGSNLSLSFKYNNVARNTFALSEYDSNFNFISKTSGENGSVKVNQKTRYVKFEVYAGTNGTDINLISNIQLEEGTLATEYEPYQEDKLTILSPVQLEKVGDVADRIIEKDGIWGVEKNIKSITFSGEENWIKAVNKNTSLPPEYRLTNAISDYKLFGTYGKGISNKYSFIGNQENCWVSTKEGFGLGSSVNKGTLYVCCNVATLDEFKTHINKFSVKYIVENPQFIPLPHSQQVKLRTFANKTNISFLTKIEGTIKAQVPKSLGATVNTHTTQISNLNKELDRVKKLEESTVSTVETESDFTTVEATNNGYFEDVKLEGKTLVNICPKPNIYAGDGDIENRVVISGNVVELSLKEGYYTGVNFTSNSSLMKPNTTYTIVANILENTMTKGNLAIIEGNPDTSFNGISIPLGYKGVFVTKATTRSSYTLPRIQSMTTTTCKTGEKVKFSLMVFEGDHTQNPPNGYIEGLKSVGDGVDEIVVSSVKGDGNLFNPSSCKYNTSIFDDGVESSSSNYVVSDFIRVKSGLKYYVSGLPVVVGYDLNKNFIKILKNTNVDEYITIPTNCSYIRIRNYNQLNTIDLQKEVVNSTYLVKGSTPKQYIPHQSDKKRLLYYNEETQSWEKPILREWDSIEKHSDGKYYYHQRSAEVVLNGSEDWVLNAAWSGEEMSTNSYYLTADKQKTAGLMIKSFGATNIISEVIPTVFINGASFDSDCVSGEKYSGAIYIRINKSKVSNGIKSYLQQNPMRVAYQLAEEKVYECTNIDLITCANETNYMVESGVIVPRTTLKVHNNISNVVSLLQKKVSLLESNMTKYMVTQNRMQLASTYSADSVTFKVDYFSLCGDEENYDEDLYNLILNNILVGKDNYDYDKMFTMILDYASWNQISWEQFDILVGLMDIQHNPPVEEEITEDETIEETPVK